MKKVTTLPIPAFITPFLPQLALPAHSTVTAIKRKAISLISLMVLALAILLCGTCQAATLDPATGLDILKAHGATFVLNCDKPPAEEVAADILVDSYGGSLVPGLSGNALRLNLGEQLVLDLSNIITSDEGTVMLWVRPHWRDDSTASHTFLSFHWSGDEKSYFALSRGWWEPDGAQRTYFAQQIIDPPNGWGANCDRFMYYDDNAWTHLTCTWKRGSYVYIWQNGSPLAGMNYSPPTVRQAAPKLYVGSDQGYPLANNRWAEADIDELAIFPKRLADEDIFEIFTTQRGLNPQPTNVEIRAIYNEMTEWMNDPETVIQRVKKAGFNVLIPSVWHGEGTRYPAEDQGFPRQWDFPGDPLARLITVAHANEIQVHASFTVALRDRNFFPDFYDPVNTAYRAFDVQRPAFRTFMVNLIVDAVTRYNVDGINLDFIRVGDKMCTCDYCKAQYAATFPGRVLTDDIAASRYPGGPDEPHLQQWADNAVRDVVQRVSTATKAVKPGLIISVDGEPWFKTPSPQGRQDVVWANDGLIDAIFAMNYNAVPNFENYHNVRRELKDPSKLIMLLGDIKQEPPYSGNWVNNDPAHLCRMVQYLQTRWPGAVGIYDYKYLSNDQVNALANGPFRLAAKPAWNVAATPASSTSGGTASTATGTSIGTTSTGTSSTGTGTSTTTTTTGTSTGAASSGTGTSSGTATTNTGTSATSTTPTTISSGSATSTGTTSTGSTAATPGTTTTSSTGSTTILTTSKSSKLRLVYDPIRKKWVLYRDGKPVSF